MRHYTLKNEERIRSGGFSDLIRLSAGAPFPYAVPPSTPAGNDFATWATTSTIILTSQFLYNGDVVQDWMIEVMTPVVGPTGAPTAALGITGTNAQFLSATSIAVSSLILPSVAPVPYTPSGTLGNLSSTNLTITFAAGGGNFAVPTALELAVWFQILRYRDRDSLYTQS